MSLLERLESLPVKSLYIGVLMVMICTLSLSFLAFHLIAAHVQKIEIDPTFDKFDQLQLESAIDEFQSGGRPALHDYLAGLDRIFGGKHYLLDAKGVDLVTGDNQSRLLPRPPATSSRLRTHGRWIVTREATDRQHWFAGEGELGRPQTRTFLPYYFLVIGATVVLCWIASIGVVLPIHKIAATIAQFGDGNLSIRVQTKRHDEIGQLGRSFNRMAGRLERLIVSERRLLGDISHELRSPLARLKFAVKLARTSPDSNSALDRIERDVNRITSLVADIVEITTIEGNPTMRDLTSVNAREVVDEVVRDCTVEAQFRECSIAVKGELAHEVRGNRELLRRAVENVLRNGIRYSPKQSTIQIALEENETHAVIAVRDFGPGVPEDALSRIFDPFFRVEEARETSSGGTGMGLSIAKRAIQVHRGTIVAENALPGLCISIKIPLAAQAASYEHDSAQNAEDSKALKIS
ncbi:MAG: ATP-binding protein [Terracidiphilus sp.]